MVAGRVRSISHLGDGCGDHREFRQQRRSATGPPSRCELGRAASRHFVLQFVTSSENDAGLCAADSAARANCSDPAVDLAVAEAFEPADVGVLVRAEDDADRRDVAGREAAAPKMTWIRHRPTRPLPSPKGWMVSNWAWAIAACATGRDVVAVHEVAEVLEQAVAPPRTVARRIRRRAGDRPPIQLGSSRSSPAILSSGGTIAISRWIALIASTSSASGSPPIASPARSPGCSRRSPVPCGDRRDLGGPPRRVCGGRCSAPRSGTRPGPPIARAAAPVPPEAMSPAGSGFSSRTSTPARSAKALVTLSGSARSRRSGRGSTLGSARCSAAFPGAGESGAQCIST